MDATHLDPASPVPRASSDPLHELRSLGEYRILRLLGEGGMGAVYLAHHEHEKREYALKVLADNLASNQAYIDRFYREAKSGLLLNHPNVVRGYTVGQDQSTGKHYLVMEYVDGPSCHVLLEKYGRLPVGDAVHVARDIANALEHAHSRNVVHRDIKPDNILVTRSGLAKLSDLGLAKRTDENSHLTATRQGFGTSYYMPYEQAFNARAVDGRSDVYALGATLYHLVTGAVPFAGDNHLEVVEKKGLGQYTPASVLNPSVPKALDQILKKMLARHPRDRYQTASELIVDLDRSNLASPVPTFADPELALQDPWVRSYMASSSQPTRPDLETPVTPVHTPVARPSAPAAGAADAWHVRYRGRNGRWVKARWTTRLIVQRLLAGQLPTDAEASHEAKGVYRPLASYEEFRCVKPARPPRARAAARKAGEAGPARKKRAAKEAEAPASRFSLDALRNWWRRVRKGGPGGGASDSSK
jgi:serine/threonine-protein kinase